MKFLVLGDLHIRNKSPERRKDNIFETQMDKLIQVLDYVIDHEIRYILQTGDFF